MAYATSNPPIKVTLGPIANFGATGGSGGDIWVYRSTDAIASVNAANYFSNGQALGMQVNDIVFVVDTTNGIVTAARVSAVASAGASLGTTHQATLQ